MKYIKVNYLFSVLVALCFTACDDTTDYLGDSIVSGADHIKASVASFYPISTTVKADTIFTRSSTAYLGKYTHPDFGSFESSFMTQFNVTEQYQIPGFDAFVPDNGIQGLEEDVYDRSITPVRMYMGGLYTNYFGDSAAVGVVNVYQLNKELYNDDDIYYSNIDPEAFYDPADLIGTASYAPVDQSIPEKDQEDKYLYFVVDLPLSKGKEIIELYQYCLKNGIEFRKEFLNQFKGIYAKQVQGDGAMLYLDQVRLYFQMQEYVLDEDGKVHKTVTGQDSITSTTFSFSSTKEIVQVNKFRNNTPEDLLEQDTCSFVKSPAGLFTQVGFPLREIADSIVAKGDSLNAISVSFKIDSLQNDNSGIQPPTALLMIQDTATVNGVFNNYQKAFFAENMLPDNETSYLSALNSKGVYSFSDIRKLISKAIEEYGGVENLPEYLNVLLIPVDLTYEQTSVIGVSHYFKPSYVQLRGGKDSERKALKMEVYYTSFQK